MKVPFFLSLCVLWLENKTLADGQLKLWHSRHFRWVDDATAQEQWQTDWDIPKPLTVRPGTTTARTGYLLPEGVHDSIEPSQMIDSLRPTPLTTWQKSKWPILAMALVLMIIGAVCCIYNCCIKGGGYFPKIQKLPCMFGLKSKADRYLPGLTFTKDGQIKYYNIDSQEALAYVDAAYDNLQ